VIAGRPPAVLAAAGFAVFAWGATPAVTRFAVGGVDPLTVGLLRTLLAALVIAPVLALRRTPRPVSGGDRTLLAISAIGGFVVFPLLFTLGQGRTTATHGALILAALPVLTGAIAALAERVAPSPFWWLGAAVAMAGEAGLIGIRDTPAGAATSLAGDLLVALACVGAAAGYVAGGRLARRIGTWPTTLWGLALGGLVAAPALAVVPLPSAAGPAEWSAIAYLAAISSIAAYAAWYWALSRGGIARVGALQFLQPLVGVALAVAWLAEPLTPSLAVAATAIVAGVVLCRR